MEKSAILKTFATRYRDSKNGRKGNPVRDFVLDYRDLLALAGAVDGDARALAEHELMAAAELSGGMLLLDHPARNPESIIRVRLSREGGEDWLFRFLGLTTPETHRKTLAEIFEVAAREFVTDPWEHAWVRWCKAMESNANSGLSVAPFSRENFEGNQELLRVLRRVLSWQGESLIRFASCVICGHSKTLGVMRSKLELALKQISGERITSLSQLGLIDTPRQVLLHGPLGLTLAGGVIDLGQLSGPVRISEADFARAQGVTSQASICLSVENETTFYELAKLHSGILLVQTSFPGRGVRKLYERLPADIAFWHFGDSDPAGYDILRDLRVRTGRHVLPLHMGFREGGTKEPLSQEESGHIERLLADPVMADVRDELLAMKLAGHKGLYEQESLGWPQAFWPFYGR